MFWLCLSLLNVPGRSAQAVLKSNQPPVPTYAVHKAPIILNADLIRVGLSDSTMINQEYPSASISATGPFRILEKGTQRIVLLGSTNKSVRISRSGSGFYLHAWRQTLGPITGTLTVEPAEANSLLKVTSIRRNGVTPEYRGVFEIAPGYSGLQEFSIVNILPLQDYLKAVVPNELPYRFGFEAEKAQAVAARNYAIHPREKPWPQFDICDSQYCQAYYGAQTEDPRTTQAIKDTQGIFALYDGKPILALYSSTNGGYSANYQNAFSDPGTKKFPGTPIPYLKAEPDFGPRIDLSTDAAAGAYYTNDNIKSDDVLSPNYRWHRRWSSRLLEYTINHYLAKAYEDGFTHSFISPGFPPGSSIGRLEKLEALERDISGKIMKLRIVGTNGSWTLEKEFVIREVLRTNGHFLPSANVVFNFIKNRYGVPSEVVAAGGGLGHSVGMSQYGASYLSKHGASFVQILQHYYNGISLGTLPMSATADHGKRTQFYVLKSQGVLHVQTTGTTPVRVAINGHTLQLTPPTDGKCTCSIQQYLIPNQLNQLTLYPAQETNTTITAWITLYKPKLSDKEN